MIVFGKLWRVLRVSFALTLFAALTGCSKLVAPAAEGGAPTLPGVVRPLHYDVAITPDAAGLRFDGHVAIAIEVVEATQSITLQAARLEIRTAGLSGTVEDEAGFGTPRVTTDTAAETATFTLERTVVPGRYQLVIEYGGVIDTQARGLHLVAAPTAPGERALATSLGNGGARRLFPSWDAPGYEATFILELTLPTGQKATGPSPLAGSEELHGDLTRLRFAPTPRIAADELTFTVGEPRNR